MNLRSSSKNSKNFQKNLYSGIDKMGPGTYIPIFEL